MRTTKTSSSEEETQKIGEDLGKNLKGGDIVALYGELGAGKTVFVKGIAVSLGIKKRILSPTFVFMRSYPIATGNQFVHIDLYRGSDLASFEALGLEEVFTKENIVVLEWADRLGKMLPPKRIDVELIKEDEQKRRVKITRN
ncbi:MAG: tRNA (adenosine(37)-N6)-threonylcarbamoyltransferase complex ATPase subunit type 1 TsaE [Candidatus Curtissbacteria bacterium]